MLQLSGEIVRRIAHKCALSEVMMNAPGTNSHLRLMSKGM